MDKQKVLKWLKRFNITGGIICLICAVYTSFTHTLGIYNAVGFNNLREWAATIAGEAMFIMGGVNLIVSRIIGRPPKIGPKIGFWIGLLLVGWSNIRFHLQYGLEGVALSLLVPVFLLISETILSGSLLDASEEQEDTSKGEREDSKEVLEEVQETPETLREVREVERLEPDAYWEALEEELETSKEAGESSKEVQDKPPKGQETSEEVVEDLSHMKPRDLAIYLEDWAFSRYEQEGKFPSRGEIRKKYNVNEWSAKVCHQEWKKKLEKKAS